MSGVGLPVEPAVVRPEQLIGTLIPPVARRCVPPVPLGVPMLPRLSVPEGRSELLLVDAARLDASGRFFARMLLKALAWSPGDRVDLRVGVEAVVIGSCAAGRQAVGSRGELFLPVAVRMLVGLDVEAQVILVAVPGQSLLVVHPPALIERLLTEYYGRGAEHQDDG